MKNFLIKFLGIVFLLMILTGCRQRADYENWILTEPKETAGGRLFAASGFLELKEAAPLYSSAAGRVKKIFVSPLSKVSARTPLVKISEPQLEKELSQLNSEILEKAREIQINRKLLQSGLLQKIQIEPLENKMKNMEAEKNSLLNQLIIKSPRSGYLAWLDVKLYQWVEPGQLLGYVFPNGPVKAGYFSARARVPAPYLKNVWAGQKVAVSSDDLGRLEGTVTLVAPFLKDEEKTAVVEVFCRLKDNPKKYFVSLPAEISFFAAERKMLILPRPAVFKGAGQSYCYFLDKKTPKILKIKPLFEGEEFIYLPFAASLVKKKIIINFDEDRHASGS